jgi:Ca2+-binding RTX toxin-like protein
MAKFFGIDSLDSLDSLNTESFAFGAGDYANGKIVDGYNIIRIKLHSPSATGTEGKDKIYGSVEDNNIVANGGNDIVYGGAGDDQISGVGGNDTLYGGDGEDHLYGGAGKDKLYAGDGNDDSLDGGSGNDTLYGGNYVTTFAPNLLAEQLFGGDGNDKIYGYNGADLLQGGKGDDKLVGGEGFDKLDGGTGNDKLYGGTGDDELLGGLGNDLLQGGAGRNELFGGKGADLFVFNDNELPKTFVPLDGSLNQGVGTISDFRRSQHDKIDLHLVDAIDGGKDNNFVKANFVGTNDFQKTVVAEGGQFRISWDAQINFVDYSSVKAIFILPGGSMLTDDANAVLPAYGLYVEGLKSLDYHDFIM